MELVNHPTVLLASPEFLASTEVFSLQLNRFKILINTDATGPRCSYELPPHSTWMQACGCHWWVPSTWRGVRLGRVSLFLRKWNLDVVDCCARSQVGTNSMSEPLRIGFWYWYSLSGSSCPVPAWGKTPWREFVVSVNLLKECLLNSQQWFISATLGICRDEVKTFYMHPLRNNIYQQTRYVRDFSTRWELECGHWWLDRQLVFVNIGSVMRVLGFFSHWQQVGTKYRSVLKAWILLTFNSGLLSHNGPDGQSK